MWCCVMYVWKHLCQVLTACCCCSSAGRGAASNVCPSATPQLLSLVLSPGVLTLCQGLSPLPFWALTSTWASTSNGQSRPDSTGHPKFGVLSLITLILSFLPPVIHSKREHLLLENPPNLCEIGHAVSFTWVLCSPLFCRSVMLPPT